MNALRLHFLFTRKRKRDDEEVDDEESLNGGATPVEVPKGREKDAEMNPAKNSKLTSLDDKEGGGEKVKLSFIALICLSMINAA